MVDPLPGTSFPGTPVSAVDSQSTHHVSVMETEQPEDSLYLSDHLAAPDEEVNTRSVDNSKRRGNCAQGKLKYEVVAGRTALTYAYATYPLKFLHPRRTVHQSHDTFVTYMLGYGGGLVGGDSVEIECAVLDGANAVLCTQATTKVFKAIADCDVVSQHLSFDVGRDATLAVLPDPITCFERSRYQQKQVVRLQPGASLVLVDWLTSGRKRNFLATGSLHDDRRETLEHWDFDEYDSSIDVYCENELVLSDRVRLVDDEAVILRKRMRGAHVLGFVVLLGGRVKSITDMLLERSQRKRLHHAHEITPQGRLSSPNDFPGVVASASPLGTDGLILRFCGEDTESALRFMRAILAPLRLLLGHTPFQENR